MLNFFLFKWGGISIRKENTILNALTLFLPEGGGALGLQATSRLSETP